MFYPVNYVDKIYNIIIVSLDGEPSMYYDTHPDDFANKQRTNAGACIFDTETERYSDVSVYKGNNGYYIKKHGKHYHFNIDVESILEE